MNATFAVKRDLDKLPAEELRQYLREVSVYIGLDPDLNGLDTVWMEQEVGIGKSLVVYARRGTAEILRNLYGVEVETLTYAEVRGSIVFTATGRAKARDQRQEIAIGAKYISGLIGKQLDDAIMTASTRALRRLTMQFTTLGILDESEVVQIVGQTPNPAGSALLAADPIPPVFAVPSVPANDAPGKDVTPAPAPESAPAPPAALGVPFVGQQDQIDAAMAEVKRMKLERKPGPEAFKADNQPDTKTPETPVTPVVATVTPDKEADIPAAKPPRKPRKSKAVVLDVEPEVVQSPANAAATPPPAMPSQVVAAVPTQADSAPALSSSVEAPPPNPAMFEPDPNPGMPTQEQMEAYRKKVGVFTEQLTPGVGMGKTQKMRAFIAKMVGVAPQNMTVVQWEQMIGWFDAQVAAKGLLGLVAHIDATIGA